MVVFDIPTGDCVSQARFPFGISSVAFSVDNQHFATSTGRSGVAYVWCADKGIQT